MEGEGKDRKGLRRGINIREKNPHGGGKLNTLSGKEKKKKGGY